MTGLRLRYIAFAAAIVCCAAAARAEVQKFLNPCGTQQLCPSFQLILTPPDGWVLEKKASSANKVQMIVPKGKNFATAPALIYVQVFYHRDKTQSLADFARVANEDWQADAKSANQSSKIS